MLATPSRPANAALSSLRARSCSCSPAPARSIKGTRALQFCARGLVANRAAATTDLVPRDLSDASEFRLRFQVSLDVGPRTAVDFGYDFTRWHSSFSGSNVLNPAGPPDQALLLEAREHAITFGIRWKP